MHTISIFSYVVWGLGHEVFTKPRLSFAQKSLGTKRLKPFFKSISIWITKWNRLGKIQFSFILVPCALSRKWITNYMYVNGSVNGLNTCKIKSIFLLQLNFLLTLRVAAECCLQIFCMIAWQWTSDECWNMLRLCTGQNLITWTKRFLLDGKVKGNHWLIH